MPRGRGYSQLRLWVVWRWDWSLKLGVKTGLGSSLVLQLDLGRWSTRPTQLSFQLVLFDAEHLGPYHRATDMSREDRYSERLGAFHRKACQFTVASSANVGRDV
jgi:hypothetical protein